MEARKFLNALNDTFSEHQDSQAEQPWTRLYIIMRTERVRSDIFIIFLCASNIHV